MKKFEQVCPDDIDTLRNRYGFLPVSMYAKEFPVEGEIGCIANTRYVICDPVIAARREEIRLSRSGTAMASPEMRAECAIMGHTFLGYERGGCSCCGAKG